MTWAGSTGKGVSITLKNYALTFSPGVLYASEKGTANGDGVQNGNETGLDAFTAPTGFSCTTPGSVLKSLSLIGVLKIAA